ncbi:MAG: peptidoglycan recognition family protein [Nanoarchaeota archaeon]|nr:peptidoglycan recognition family protein [Nanoarchaeota archaeon]
MELLGKVNKIIIHHSQRQNDFPEFIRQRHIQRGFEDIGYHWLVDAEGNLYKGRDEKFIGAHVFGHNKDSFGVCLIGDLDKAHPTKKQISTLIEFLRDKAIQNKISTENILGHREFPNVTKTCPGKFVDMEEIRRLVEN